MLPLRAYDQCPCTSNSRFKNRNYGAHVSHGSRTQIPNTTYLSDGIVGRVDSLQTLLARDADTNVRSLDHADIVRAVSNRERHRPEAILDEFHHKRLLERRHTAADHALALHREPQEQVLVLVVGQSLEQSGSGASVLSSRSPRYFRAELGDKGEVRTCVSALPSMTKIGRAHV